MSCVNEDTIVAFIDARLPPTRIAHVEAHVRACASCHELLSLALAAAPAPKRPAPESLGADQFQPAPSGGGILTRGTSFGRYTVLGPLGRGGMGDVYAAYDPELDRKVALKVLRTRGDVSDERRRGRLLREAKAIARLRHPNVVVVHDAGTVGDRVFLAMEYIDGQTLETWLAEPTRTRQQVLDAFIGAGLGLAAAHAAGLAHRDFKPQNVMVGSDGRSASRRAGSSVAACRRPGVVACVSIAELLRFGLCARRPYCRPDIFILRDRPCTRT